MIRKLSVWDLDGTLVDSSHRYRNLSNGSIDLPYWKRMATPENIAKDSVIRNVHRIYLQDLACIETFTVVCTARVMSVADYEFINQHLGNPNMILPRQGENDCRKDWDLKTDHLVKFDGKFKEYRFFDDNIGNLEAIQKLGYHCWQVAKLFAGSFQVRKF